jgi:hypothetical protein
MTYLELAVKILKMDKEQAQSDVTIFSEGEFYPAELLISSESDETGDVLDNGHPYLKPKDVE